MTEITKEIKLQILSQNIGQKCKHPVDRGTFLLNGIDISKSERQCLLYGDWSGGTHPQLSCNDWVDIDDFKLIKKPLSAISDEDAIEVAKLIEAGTNHKKYTIERRDNCIVVWFAHWCIQIHFDGRVKGSSATMWINSNVYTYLSAKGYDLPSIYLGGKTLFEAGLAIYEKHYYRFVYKDNDGQLGYTIVCVGTKNNEIAIEKFEKSFPELVWRRFEEVAES